MSRLVPLESRLVPLERLTAFDRILLNIDPPKHTHLRAMLAPFFSVRRTQEMESGIDQTVQNLLSAFPPGGEVDFMKDFANSLPILVISDILGMPSDDIFQMRTWVNDILAGFDSALANADVLKKQAIGLQSLIGYLTRLVDTQPVNGTGLVSHLNRLRRDADGPSGEEILSLCLLILFAGYETTVNLLGNGLNTLLSNPDQLALLRSNPDLMPGAIDEMLRFESPLQRSTFRVVKHDLSIGGFKLEEGQQLGAIIGAANRDPGQFIRPDDFDITRDPNQHLSFGLGIHKCLGERLARLEAGIAFTRLLQKYSKINLINSKPDWQQKTFLRGLRTLAVQFDH